LETVKEAIKAADELDEIEELLKVIRAEDSHRERA
jgi:hypothetical protein